MAPLCVLGLRLRALLVPGLQQVDHFDDALRSLLGASFGGVIQRR
jgi:hypothetical protein